MAELRETRKRGMVVAGTGAGRGGGRGFGHRPPPAAQARRSVAVPALTISPVAPQVRKTPGERD